MSTPFTEVNLTSPPAVNLDVEPVDALAPLRWLKQGFDDFRRMPGLSILYGAAFAALCAAVYILSRSLPWYTLGYLTGLVVSGPFLASGLYAASRDLSRGRTPSIAGSLLLLSQRKTYLALFSLMLALIMAAWVRFSAVLFAIKFNTLSPSVEAYTSLFTSADGWITLAYFGGIGFMLVAAVFTVSAIAIPAILDKDANFIQAMQTSYRAVVHNPAAMCLWAVLIVMMTFFGLATAFIGLAFVFPLLGYATWHSYQDLAT